LGNGSLATAVESLWPTKATYQDGRYAVFWAAIATIGYVASCRRCVLFWRFHACCDHVLSRKQIAPKSRHIAPRTSTHQSVIRYTCLFLWRGHPAGPGRAGTARSMPRSSRDVKLVPGMPVDTFLETSERTVLSYLVKPLRDQIMKAFRDGW